MDYVSFAAPVTEMDVVFVELEIMVVVRFHALLGAQTTFQFWDVNNASVCSTTTIVASSQIGSWQWFTLYCVPTYVDFNFQFVFPAEYVAQCTPNAFSAACTTWQEETCIALGYTFNDPSALNNYRGCNRFVFSLFPADGN